MVSRRHFLVTTVTAAGALVVGIPFEVASADEPRASPSGFRGEIGPFVRIEPDNRIIVGVPNPEIGQGVATSLPMLIAEELDVDFDTVTTWQMPSGLTRNAAGEYSWKIIAQGSGGSNSVRSKWQPLREAGATARYLILQAAAQRTGIAFEQLQTESGHVVTPGGDRIPYGELARAAAEVDPPSEPVALKRPSEFKLLGTPQPMMAAREIITGKPLFGLDTEVPGMLYAVVEHSPYLDGHVISYDDSRTKEVKGVRHVVPVKGPAPGEPYNVIANGLAVVADSLWAAIKGRKALVVEWDGGPHSAEDSAGFKQHCNELLNGQGQIVASGGDFAAVFQSAPRRFEARYWLPFIAHAQLEPENCFAHVEGNRCRIIAPTQSPGGAAAGVERVTGIPLDNIEVEVARAGGGFGRRLATYEINEAALISQAVQAPVKLVWTRADDMRNDMYRPAGYHHLQAALDADGRLVAFAHRLASASKYYRRSGVPEEDYHSPEMYDGDFPENFVPNFKKEYFSAKSGLPRGSWRAPAHAANAFAIQSFLDEIAHEAGIDPFQFRLQVLGEPRPLRMEGEEDYHSGRLTDVLKKAVHEAGPAPSGAGRGRGMAYHFTFGGYCAQVMDIDLSDGVLKIDRVTAAIDCGFAVNPNGVRAQVEGAVNDGLSACLEQEITVAGGRIQQENFDTYRMMRIDRAPAAIDVHIIGTGNPAVGAGEIGLPPVAPALANAIFNASGKRIREMPLLRHL